MNAVTAMRDIPVAPRRFRDDSPADSARPSTWGVCFAVILAVHAGILASVLAPKPEVAEGFPQDAVSVDLMPDLTDPSERRDDVPGVTVPQSDAPPSEQERADDATPPAPEAPPPTVAETKPETAPPEVTAPLSPSVPEAELPAPTKELASTKPPDPVPPEDKPTEVEKDVHPQEIEASEASTGSASAPLLDGGRRPSAAVQATWRSMIGRHLGTRRRYPVAARARGFQGLAKVRVSIDANGHVLESGLVQSSGYPLLDGEALALIKRSDPLPKPPEGMVAPIMLTVPVVFALR